MPILQPAPAKRGHNYTVTAVDHKQLLSSNWLVLCTPGAYEPPEGRKERPTPHIAWNGI